MAERRAHPGVFPAARFLHSLVSIQQRIMIEMRTRDRNPPRFRRQNSKFQECSEISDQLGVALLTFRTPAASNFLAARKALYARLI
jgi:hypothetical protein